MQECAICYEAQGTTPFFFNCTVCVEGVCCFNCYDKLNTAKCPICRTHLASVVNGMHIIFFLKYQCGVHDKNTRLIPIVNRFSPLVSYLHENRRAFELEGCLETESPESPVQPVQPVQPPAHPINYDEYHEILNNEFPICPFVVSLDYKMLMRLDEPFFEGDPEMVIIRDSRVLCDTFGFYEMVKHEKDVAECDLEIYKHSDDYPITLRQVIAEMSMSSHYDNEYVMQDDHRFLEGLSADGVDEYEIPIYSPWFGS